MNYFKEVPEASIIVRSRGVYRQVGMFARNGVVYAKQGGGFVKLSQGGATSQTGTMWVDIDAGDAEVEESKGLVRIKESDVVELKSVETR